MESRALPTPYVMDILISDSGWSSDYLDELENQGYGSDGYSVFDNSSDVHWSGIDTISIVFNEDVDVSSDALTVAGVNQSWYDIYSFSYNSSTHTATWVLDDSVDSDNIYLDLDGDGPNAVTDTSGNKMGSDDETSISVLAGDVDSNGTTNYFDYIDVDQVDGTSIGDANYDLMADIDGSGEIDDYDLTIIGWYLGEDLPSGDPENAGNDAPYITDFEETSLGNDTWKFTGTVNDTDDTVDSSWVVDFSGAFSATVSVNSDGTFEYTYDFSSTGGGWVYADTEDPHDAESETVSVYV